MLRITTSALVLASLSLVAEARTIEFEPSGQFRIRQQHYDIYEGRADQVDTTLLRVRAGLGFNLGEGRRVFLSPQAVKAFGSTTNTGTGADPSYNPTLSGNLQFHEAYADVPMGSAQLRLGRQVVSYGEQKVFGSRNWAERGQALEGFKISHPLAGGNLDLGYMKIANDDFTTIEDDVTAMYLYFQAARANQTEFDLYFVRNVDSDFNEDRDSYSVGFRYRRQLGAFGFVTENIYQYFDKLERSASHLNLDFWYRTGQLRPFVNLATSSRDYDQLYANRHSHNGHLDMVGRRNLTAASLGAQYFFSDQWDLTAEYFQFHRADNRAPAYRQSATAVLAGDLDETFIGQELDVTLRFRPRAGETLHLAYTTFLHGDYFDEQETSTFIYAQYTLSF